MDQSQIIFTIFITFVIFYIFYRISKSIAKANKEDISNNSYMKLNKGVKYPFKAASKAIPSKDVRPDTVFEPSEF